MEKRISYGEYLVLKDKGLVAKDDLLERLRKLGDDIDIEYALGNDYEAVLRVVKEYTVLTDNEINDVSLLNVDVVAYVLAALQYHISEGGLVNWTYYVIPPIFAVNVVLED